MLKNLIWPLPTTLALKKNYIQCFHYNFQINWIHIVFKPNIQDVIDSYRRVSLNIVNPTWNCGHKKLQLRTTKMTHVKRKKQTDRTCARQSSHTHLFKRTSLGRENTRFIFQIRNHGGFKFVCPGIVLSFANTNFCSQKGKPYQLFLCLLLLLLLFSFSNCNVVTCY